MFDLRPYRPKRTALSDFLPWAALIAPGIVLNKDGAFQRTLGFRGRDLDSSTPSELMGASLRLNNALRRFGSNWCLHVEARRAPAPGYPDSDWPDGLSYLIDEERRAVFETAGERFESSYFLTLTWLAPAERERKLETLVFDGAREDGAGYREHLDRFIAESEAFMALLEGVMAEARWLDDEETLTYLHDCVSDRPHRVAVPGAPFHLDAVLCDAHLLGGMAPRLGAAHLRTISVRAFVTETEPGLLDALNRLAIPYRWVTRFIPLDTETARAEMEKIRKRWFSKRKGLLTLLREALFREEASLLDNDAANQALDSDAALQDLGAGALSAGFTTLTITIMAGSEQGASDIVRQIQQVTDGLGFVTQVETVNAVEAWLGSLPGQAYADVRRPLLLSTNLAHLLPTSAVWAGPTRNAHLNGPALMLTATDGATPFRFDIHAGDVGHTMIVGPTGAGKSVSLSMLAAQFLRYPRAQVFMFDKGRSARAMVLGLGGDYLDLGVPDALGLQPLARLDEDATRAWALDWLASIADGAGVKLGPEARADLWRVLEILGGRPIEDRTLTLVAALTQDTALRAALGPFTQSGPHGRLVDVARSTLARANVQAFEMGELMQQPRAIGPVLQAIFHELERRFDGRPTLLILDEAWLFLRDEVFTSKLRDWLKTLRKHNVAVVFASQEIADVETSAIASTILEACHTRVFLPNDRAREPRSRGFYEGLGLNARQIELLAEATPKRDYYLVARDGCRLFDLDLGPVALAFAAASRPEDHALLDRIIADGGGPFAPSWLEARGLGEAARAFDRLNARHASERDQGSFQTAAE